MADTASDGNRFAPITADNHSGSLWIATLVCLVYSFITVATRGWLRLKMYGMDDFLILLSFVCHLAECIAIILGLNHGLGQTFTPLTSSDVSYVSKSAFASIILYIMAAVLAKCSTLYLMMRLFNLNGRKAHTNHQNSQRLYLFICLAILSVMAVWGVASVIAVSVDCRTSTFLLGNGEAQCPSQELRWQVITGYDIATEILLVFTAVLIVAPVQLAFHLKLQVVTAFLLRLPLIALAVLRLHYLQRVNDSENPGLAQVPVLVIQQVYLCWTIISATIPNLKSFVRSFGSGFGIGIDMESYTNAYGSKHSGRNKSYEMGSVHNEPSPEVNGSATRNRNMNSRLDEYDQEEVRPIRSVNSRQGNVVHTHPLPRSAHGTRGTGEEEQGSIESTGSDARIIRKDVQWQVAYEDNGPIARAL